VTATTSTTPGLTADQIGSLTFPELVARYRRGLEYFDRRVFDLSDEQADMAFLPDAGVGRWPVRVLVGHLADAELAVTHRMRRAVAEEHPVVSPWDENAFVDAGLYAGGQHPIAGFVAVLHTTRRWTAEWLHTLSAEQLQRRVLHPEKGELSVQRMTAMTTWHLEHHARYLNAKICRLLGPAPAEEEADTGGCGPGCGCRHK
jgi:DinB superfamily